MHPPLKSKICQLFIVWNPFWGFWVLESLGPFRNPLRLVPFGVNWYTLTHEIGITNGRANVVSGGRLSLAHPSNPSFPTHHHPPHPYIVSVPNFGNAFASSAFSKVWNFWKVAKFSEVPTFEILKISESIRSHPTIGPVRIKLLRRDASR